MHQANFHNTSPDKPAAALLRLGLIASCLCVWLLWIFSSHAAAQTNSAAEEIPLALPKNLSSTDPITPLLRAKKYEEALEKLSPLLESETEQDLFLRLYQRGLAQLFLGQKKHNDDLIKDAGLSFMSVVIYNPHSSYLGPCLMETALVHQHIGRADLASSLYEKAALIIDAQQEPELARRLAQLYGSFKRQRATKP